METIEEEVAAIAAIYCGEGECSIVHQGCDSVVLCLCVTPLKRDDLNVNVTFTLKPETYPQNPPPVSVQSLALSRAGCEEIKTFLEEKGREFAGMPMILDLLTALQEKESFHGIIKEQMNTSEKATEESSYIMTDESVCLDAPDASSSKDPQVRIMACNELPRQKWTYDEPSKQIRHVQSGLCLDLPSQTHPDTLSLQLCDSTLRSQRWIFEDVKWSRNQ
ncbi:uncharacterized protein LOC143028326 isoform X2 [Oratosquilla oratoria]|uniref:uncharacterized protein LOC143028326 isoform X2 n=1 Tax=Oratosquilla oratoria TaxID=337810 RepID=UPI003F76EDC5